jgi:hypothetical protein
MRYNDLLLVYDLLGIVIARGKLHPEHDLTTRHYARRDVLSCMCMLWRERLIPAPEVETHDRRCTICFTHGANEAGATLHRLLRKALLSQPAELQYANAAVSEREDG